jgi:membrane-anchored protein YejM (alkaline phosphatase superfamily)
MPQLELFAKKSQDFTNNFCASDNPRDNNFALYYGLWPNYFPTFMKTLRSPVLFEELTKNTYELRAFMAQDFALADDKQFLFLSIPHSDQSNPKATKLEQHNLLLQDFKSWQLTRETSLPFAAFIHFDLAKFPVDFDTTTVHERPYSKDLNILHPNQISGSMQNGYLNAVAYQDQLLGELLDFVSQHTWADQTIIVITSNGESVLALSNEKYHVPLLIYIPNQKGERATHYTTNLNIVPSLFKLLGYNMSPNSYCNAADLWDCKNADAIQLVSRKGQYEVTFNNQKFTFSQEQFEQFDSLMDRTQLKALAKSITNENHKFYN